MQTTTKIAFLILQFPRPSYFQPKAFPILELFLRESRCWLWGYNFNECKRYAKEQQLVRWAYLLSENGLWDVFGSRICVGKERKCRREKRQNLATKLKKNFLSFLSTHPTINQIPNSALGKVGAVEGLNQESWYWTIIPPCPLTRKRNHPISGNSRNWYIFPDTGWLGELYCTKEGHLVVWRKENHKEHSNWFN